MRGGVLAAVVTVAVLLGVIGAYVVGYVSANVEAKRCVTSLGLSVSCKTNILNAPIYAFTGQ